MVGESTKVCRRKRKKNRVNSGVSVDLDARGVNSMEGCGQVTVEVPQNEPVRDIDSHDEDMDQQNHAASAAQVQDKIEEARVKRNKRGPTKMKRLARDPADRIQIQYTDLGEPYGPGSVQLSSFL
ncbi:unnamed protein product, partial [Cuscuta epithymum]